MTKGNCMGRGDDDYDDYAPPHLDSEEVAASSDLEPAIPFMFRPRYVYAPPTLRG